MSDADLPYKNHNPVPEPVMVKGIAMYKEAFEAWIPQSQLFANVRCGDFVRVRPTDPKYENKTYLGIYIGEISASVGVAYHQPTEMLVFENAGHNPAIFVPDLSTLIFGYESWWGKIDNEEQLRQITDDDINNVWYVRALKQLQKQEAQAS